MTVVKQFLEIFWRGRGLSSASFLPVRTCGCLGAFDFDLALAKFPRLANTARRGAPSFILFKGCTHDGEPGHEESRLAPKASRRPSQSFRTNSREFHGMLATSRVNSTPRAAYSA